MTTVAASCRGRISGSLDFAPKMRHSKSASARAHAEIAITSGEKISSGRAVRKRARNAISTVSQIRSQPEPASELHPARLFHQDDLPFQLMCFRLQLFCRHAAFLGGLLGLMQKLDALRELRTPLLQLRAQAGFRLEGPARLLHVHRIELLYFCFVPFGDGPS